MGLAHIVEYAYVKSTLMKSIPLRAHTQYPHVQAAEEGLESVEGVRIILRETDQVYFAFDLSSGPLGLTRVDEVRKISPRFQPCPRAKNTPARAAPTCSAAHRRIVLKAVRPLTRPHSPLATQPNQSQSTPPNMTSPLLLTPTHLSCVRLLPPFAYRHVPQNTVDHPLVSLSQISTSYDLTTFLSLLPLSFYAVLTLPSHPQHRHIPR